MAAEFWTSANKIIRSDNAFVIFCQKSNGKQNTETFYKNASYIFTMKENITFITYLFPELYAQFQHLKMSYVITLFQLLQY